MKSALAAGAADRRRQWCQRQAPAISTTTTAASALAIRLEAGKCKATIQHFKYFVFKLKAKYQRDITSRNR